MYSTVHGHIRNTAGRTNSCTVSSDKITRFIILGVSGPTANHRCPPSNLIRSTSTQKSFAKRRITEIVSIASTAHNTFFHPYPLDKASPSREGSCLQSIPLISSDRNRVAVLVPHTSSGNTQFIPQLHHNTHLSPTHRAAKPHLPSLTQTHDYGPRNIHHSCPGERPIRLALGDEVRLGARCARSRQYRSPKALPAP